MPNVPHFTVKDLDEVDSRSKFVNVSFTLDFDVTAHFGTEEYTVTLHTERKTIYKSIDIFTDGFEREFEAFAKTVRYNRMEISFDRLIRPVFVLNAINRSLESGKEEKIHNFEF